jgi:hypothetical protein
MPTILNYAEHDWHFPKQVGVPMDLKLAETDRDAAMKKAMSGYVAPQLADAITFPRKGRDAEGNPFIDPDTKEMLPSQTVVSEAILAQMREHRVAKSWFAPTGLNVKETAPAKRAEKG